jgi:hypothetical protein
MDKKTLLSTVATVLLLFAVFVYCVPAESIIGVEGESRSYGYRPVQDSFDRESCERDCRERYGTELFHRGRGGHTGYYYVYARCIQDCETRFWKEYDRRMRELEKEKP